MTSPLSNRTRSLTGALTRALALSLASVLAAGALGGCGGGSSGDRATSATPDASPPPSGPGSALIGSDASTAASGGASAKAAPQPAAGTAPSRVLSQSFDSAALGVKKTYRVYVPKGYDDSQRRFPVIYYLHGLGGNESNWLEHGDLKAAADAAALSAIVVMPDGDASFYVDRSGPSYDACAKEKPPFNPSEQAATYCAKTPRYEAYVTQDLVREVDARFRTLARRESRGIGGLSMGGFGSMQLAMRHTDLYSAVATHSALLSLTYVDPHPYDASRVVLAKSPAEWGKGYPASVQAHLKSIFGPTIDNWVAHDPVTLAGKLEPGKLAIHFDCGTEDDFKFADHARQLHDVLDKRGVAHSFELAPGRHDFTYWKARLPKGLAFFASKLDAG
jgi:putative tributyrin esterase